MSMVTDLQTSQSQDAATVLYIEGDLMCCVGAMLHYNHTTSSLDDVMCVWHCFIDMIC